MKAKNLKIKKFKKRGLENKNVVTVKASIKQLNYIDYLLDLSLLSIKQKDKIIIDSVFYTEGEAEEIINFLLENQKDLIDSGSNYSQTDILKKLKWIKH